jgi:hypothetical protein
MKIYYSNISKYGKEEKFNFKVLQFLCFYLSILRTNSQGSILKTACKNYFMIVAIL